ncbi:MAG: hypothetical protein EP338_13700 [Bacteroidetes bacterium]|nr:MAG: hypothetical protein EP338_13700 [Bacteroidota bacterium]
MNKKFIWPVSVMALAVLAFALYPYFSAKEKMDQVEQEIKLDVLSVPPCQQGHSSGVPQTSLLVEGFDMNLMHPSGQRTITFKWYESENRYRFLDPKDGDDYVANDLIKFVANAYDQQLGIRHVELRMRLTKGCGPGFAEYQTVNLKAVERLPPIVPVGEEAPFRKSATSYVRLNELFQLVEPGCRPHALDVWVLAYNNNHCAGTVAPAGMVESKHFLLNFAHHDDH